MATTDKSNREREIFEAALDIASAEGRLAYLKGACGADVALLARVQALLQAHEAPEGFLPERPREGATVSMVTEKPGDKIGHYKLLEQIGEGGMGTVWVAEQTQPIRRVVALKVIKLGMDTKQVIARFEAERQALAMMDHPNIAKVLDAGVTETGRPYFVMERVKGIPITDYCDQHHLSTGERLDLFVQVCHAIQHAHQKGIIHRDIKPSNILVALQDGVPVPKVIDFGIAKATAGQRLTELTLHTALAEFIGTPAYMSPEQAEMTGLDIDTRSDIYSLGVLLYELLTGKTPFDAKRLVQAGMDGIRRIIREEEPPRPSTKLSTLATEEQTNTAKRRQTDPPRLIYLVRGDLDWIVMKCLKKDRTRRYETANGLASDLLRHVRNEPVLACPPSRLYRFQKLVRRNKLIFGAAGAVAAALLLGLGLSTWLFFKERAARQRAVTAEQAQSQLRQQAQSEAAKSQQVAAFLKEMLKGVGPSVALGQDITMLKEILDQTAERVGKDLANQPEVQAELRSVIGNTYFELEDYPRAEAMHHEALRLRRAAFGKTNEFVADSAYDLGVVLWQTSSAASPQKLAEAERLFREALGIRQTLFGRGREVACCFGYLGMALADQGKLGEAEKMFRQALQALGPNESGDSPETALALCYLGRLVAKRGALQEAENLQRRALAIRRSVLGTNDDAFGESLVDLANVLASEGKQAESEALQDEALALVNKLSARKRPWPSNFAAGLGFLYRNQGKLAKAETSFRAEVANRRKLYGPDHGATERSIEMLTSVLLGEGKLAEAAQVLGAEIERRRKFQPTVGFADALDFLSRVLRANGDIDTAQARHREAMRIRANLNEIGKTDDMNAFAWAIARSDDATPAEATRAVEVANKAVATTNRKDAALLDTLAAALARHGDFRQAVAVQEEAIRQLTNPALKSDFTSRLNLYTAGKPYTDEVELAQLLASCTSGLLSEGKFIEAESPGRRCLALREKDLPDDWRTFNSRSMLGGALLGQKKYAEAEPLLLSGCKGMKERENKMPAGAQQWLKEARQRLVELYEATGKPEEAAKWKGE